MVMTSLAQATKADAKRAGKPRNRKDVLGLANTNKADLPSLLPSLKRLALAGFRVQQAAPEHWIIRGSTPLPEFHCYSEQELRQFTINKT